MATTADPTDLTDYQLRLPSFEGPLDLLLRLIEREQLPIAEISLVAVTDQFLAHLGAIDRAAPEAIASFTAVAGRLLLLKSRALLPRPATVAEESSDDDLVRQLAEYRAVRQAGERLGHLDKLGLSSFSRGAGIAMPLTVAPRLAPGSSAALARALRRRLALIAPPPLPTPRKPVVSLHQMIGRVLAAFERSRAVAFWQVFDYRERRQMRVGFLAVLVLMRRQAIDAEQPVPFGEITLRLLDRALAEAALLGDEST
ncbi:MAG: segregation/condensation protein A [Thermomicrobiales bacterium]|nr:segregation/condensation protein A [Thermomicrobiales bacterium]